MCRSSQRFVQGLLGCALLILFVHANDARGVQLTLNPNFQTQTFELVTGDAGDTRRAVGRHPTASLGIVRSFTTIDLSAIPAGATIYGAAYSVPTDAITGTPPPTITLEAIDPSRVVTSAVTWGTYNGTNSWTTPGGDLTGVLGSVSPPPTAGSPLVFAPTIALVNEINARRSAGQSLQFVLRGSNETTGAAGFIRTVAGVIPGNPGTLSGTLNVLYASPGEQIFGVDYGATGQSVQAGFTAQAITTASSVTTTVFPGMTATLSIGSGSLMGRNRADGSGLLGTVTNTSVNNLVTDLVFNAPISGNQNSTAAPMSLEIAGLPAGNYTFTGYFNDSFFSTSTGDDGLSGNVVEILDSLGAVIATLNVSDVRNGDTDGPLAIATFDFAADGLTPELFSLRGVGADARFAFNGFSVSAASAAIVPEPSAALLWATVALVSGVTLRLRRRKGASQ